MKERRIIMAVNTPKKQHKKNPPYPANHILVLISLCITAKYLKLAECEREVAHAYQECIERKLKELGVVEPKTLFDRVFAKSCREKYSLSKIPGIKNVCPSTPSYKLEPLLDPEEVLGDIIDHLSDLDFWNTTSEKRELIGVIPFFIYKESSIFGGN